MKDAIIFFALFFSINAIPIDVNAASNAVIPIYMTAQSAITGKEELKSNKRHHNFFRRFGKKNTSLNKVNTLEDSNGKLAIILLLASFVMLILPSVLLVLALVAYLTSIFFAILGLVKDKHKAYSIFALVFALIPIILLLAFLISCKNHNCFD